MQESKRDEQNELQQVQVQEAQEPQQPAQAQPQDEKFVVEKGVIRLRMVIIRVFIFLWLLWMFAPLIYSLVSGPCARGGQYCRDSYYSVLIVPESVGEENTVNLCCSQNVTLLTAHVQDGVCCQLANHFYFAPILIPLLLITVFFFGCFVRQVTTLTIKAEKVMADSEQQPQELQQSTQLQNTEHDLSPPDYQSTHPSQSSTQAGSSAQLFDILEDSSFPTSTSRRTSASLYQPPSISSLAPLLEMSNVASDSNVPNKSDKFDKSSESNLFTVSLSPPVTLPSAPPQSMDDEWATMVDLIPNTVDYADHSEKRSQE